MCTWYCFMYSLCNQRLSNLCFLNGLIEFFRQQENEKNQEISNILLKIV